MPSAFTFRMATPMSVEAANAGFELPGMDRAGNLPNSAPRISHGSEQSFRAGWQSLLALGRATGPQTELDTAHANQIPPIPDAKENPKDLGLETRDKHPGAIRSRDGMRVVTTDKPLRKTSPAADLAQIGAIQPNVAVNMAVPTPAQS